MSNKTALFHNFTDKPFTGHWDGKPKTIKAGQKEYMPEYLARHFAKHLTNKVLVEKGQYNYTSPKFPEQVPAFMDLFKKAFILEEDAEDQSELDTEIEVANRNRAVEPTLNIPDTRKAPTPPAPTQDKVEDAPIQNDPELDEEFGGVN